MIEPKFQIPFLLLGRSRLVESWVEGSALWSDFGGNHNKGDVEDSAAHEIVQECLGLLVSFQDQNLFAKALRDNVFVFKCENEYAIVFLVRFAWRPSIVFEFQTLHTQLRALSRISRGVSLTCAERLLLLKFNWMKSQKDSALRDLVHHPAVQIRKQVLPVSIVQEAANEFSTVVKSAKQSIQNDSPAVVCWVVDGVRNAWLEKDRIELFSVQQLQCAIGSAGLCCAEGKAIELSKGFADALRFVMRALSIGHCDPVQ